jgi:crotonobetainyl-CoA:carnitine CoA-transferase CaiB-like acyl-CoA transferase
MLRYRTPITSTTCTTATGTPLTKTTTMSTDASGPVRRPAPPLGENTVEVLAGLGYDADAIAAMYADQIVR